MKIFTLSETGECRENRIMQDASLAAWPYDLAKATICTAHTPEYGLEKLRCVWIRLNYCDCRDADIEELLGTQPISIELSPAEAFFAARELERLVPARNGTRDRAIATLAAKLRDASQALFNLATRLEVPR